MYKRVCKRDKGIGVVREGLQPMGKDGAEDGGLGIITHLDVTNGVEVAQEARRDDLSTASRRSHTPHQRDVNDLSEGELLAIIPPLLIEPLSENLDWGLCAILLA
mmetsp:Transcript_18880/g.22424  ORF Transcript_18880/g.22424 Transcript_18880/m.22424 type:complete len:105 (+) Transcript_18880:5775-6089(+)